MRQPVYDGCAADRTQAVLLQWVRALRRWVAQRPRDSDPNGDPDGSHRRVHPDRRTAGSHKDLRNATAPVASRRAGFATDSLELWYGIPAPGCEPGGAVCRVRPLAELHRVHLQRMVAQHAVDDARCIMPAGDQAGVAGVDPIAAGHVVMQQVDGGGGRAVGDAADFYG